MHLTRKVTLETMADLIERHQMDQHPDRERMRNDDGYWTVTAALIQQYDDSVMKAVDPEVVRGNIRNILHEHGV